MYRYINIYVMRVLSKILYSVYVLYINIFGVFTASTDSTDDNSFLLFIYIQCPRFVDEQNESEVSRAN